MSQTTPPPARGLAVAALVSGLLAATLVLSFWLTPLGAPALYGGLAIGIIAVILGILALRARQPKALAVTGIIAGVLAVVLAIVVILFALLFVGAITF